MRPDDAAMDTPTRKAVAALVGALSSVACIVLAYIYGSDLSFAIGVALFLAVIVLVIQILRSSGSLRGLAFAILPVIGLLSLPLNWKVRDEVVKSDSYMKMKVIANAMDSYHYHHGRFPPAALCDELGHPLVSWRVLILPYLEEEALFKEFRLDEPWNSPHNLALLPRMPRAYAPPHDVQAEPNRTFYQAFVGKGPSFEEPQGHGTSKTILFVEAGEAVLWTKPADLAYSANDPLPPLGGVLGRRQRGFIRTGPNPLKGFHVACTDGFVRFLPLEGSEKTLRDIITKPP
jgi:hypothetical protein